MRKQGALPALKLYKPTCDCQDEDNHSIWLTHITLGSSKCMCCGFCPPSLSTKVPLHSLYGWKE